MTGSPYVTERLRFAPSKTLVSTCSPSYQEPGTTGGPSRPRRRDALCWGPPRRRRRMARHPLLANKLLFSLSLVILNDRFVKWAHSASACHYIIYLHFTQIGNEHEQGGGVSLFLAISSLILHPHEWLHWH
jgi:hypothetical protein